MKHNGSFHLARMTESTEVRLPNPLYAVRSESPIGSEDELRLGKLGFQLAQCGAQRYIISAVTIQQKYFLRAHHCDRAAKFNHHLNIRHLADAQCPVEKKDVSRITRPKRWQAKDFMGALFLNSPSHSSHDVGICREREMRPMLFEGAEREKDDRAAPFELFDFGPGQVFQEHDGRTVYEIGRNVKRKR